MRAITPRWCAAAAAAAADPPIRREIVAAAAAAAVVFVRLPFVLPLRRRGCLRHHPRLLSAATNSPIMGSPSDNKKEEEEEEEEQWEEKEKEKEKEKSPAKEKEKEKEKEKQLQPQPPEKPLPGDCCGSGCVRCIWDVYYEDLDAYQKTLSSTSNPKHN